MFCSVALLGRKRSKKKQKCGSRVYILVQRRGLSEVSSPGCRAVGAEGEQLCSAMSATGRPGEGTRQVAHSCTFK